MMVKSKPLKLFLELTGALAGFFALAVQLFITTDHYMSDGLTVFGALIRYLGFFTILNNIMVALILSVSAFRFRNRLSLWLQKIGVISGVVVYIIVVGVVYNTLLRHLWHPTGIAKVADTILHEVMPILYVTYWLLCVEKGKLEGLEPWTWLTFPLLYLTYVLIQGWLVDFYPYPFVNVLKLGLQRVLINSIALTLAFLILGFLILGIDRVLGRHLRRRKA